ncbi:MAG: hypothetical protein FWG05_05240, partial [Kiritimatiellaeota bacterium]|nr:hypothetical protein [Kiritimatiellota bacterium]
MKKIIPLILAAAAILAVPRLAKSDTAQDAVFDSPDNKTKVRASLGVRKAVNLNPKQIEVTIGMSVNEKAAADPRSYRIISHDDPRYAYDKFVMPVKASIRKELEADAPDGCDFAKFERTVVTLDLPYDLENEYVYLSGGEEEEEEDSGEDNFVGGKSYSVVAQGVDGLMVTGGRTAAPTAYDFSWELMKALGFPLLDDLDVLGLRRLESVGNGIIRLEFGPCFSTAAAEKIENYEISVGGKSVKPVAIGRRTMVCTYLPDGWPFPAIPVHDIFLRLPAPLEDGQRVVARVARTVTTAKNNASLNFDSGKSLTYSIKANQIGYITDSPVKIAYLGRYAGSLPALGFSTPPAFSLIGAYDERVAFTGTSKFVHKSGDKNEGVYNVDHSGENVYTLDFSEFKTPGDYFISVPGVGRSHKFRIADDVYANPLAIQAHGLFTARCGIELAPPHTPWTRIACHTNGLLATSKPRRDGEFIDPSFIIKRPVEHKRSPAAEKLDKDPALAAWWPLDGSLKDASGHGHDLGGGAAFSSAPELQPKDRKVFGPTSRDANGAKADLTLNTSQGVTICGWFKKDKNIKFDGTLFGFMRPAKDAQGLSVYANWGMLLATAGNAELRYERLAPDVWHHIALVVPAEKTSPRKLQLFHNGKSVAESAGEITTPDIPLAPEFLLGHTQQVVVLQAVGDVLQPQGGNRLVQAHGGPGVEPAAVPAGVVVVPGDGAEPGIGLFPIDAVPIEQAGEVLLVLLPEQQAVAHALQVDEHVAVVPGRAAADIPPGAVSVIGDALLHRLIKALPAKRVADGAHDVAAPVLDGKVVVFLPAVA